MAQGWTINARLGSPFAPSWAENGCSVTLEERSVAPEERPGAAEERASTPDERSGATDERSGMTEERSSEAEERASVMEEHPGTTEEHPACQQTRQANNARLVLRLAFAYCLLGGASSLVKTTMAQPTHKDVAEFYRLALAAGLCAPSNIVHWADSIIGAGACPDYAFIELSLSGAQPVSTVISLLSRVPGQAASELPARMLFGYCLGLVRADTRSATDVILQLYRISRLGSLPEHFADTLSWYEDMLSLARDGVYGTLPEVAEHFSTFLSDFESYANLVLPGTA